MLVIHARNYFDGTNFHRYSDVMVRVSGRLIVDVVHGKRSVPDCRVVSHGEATLVPGLVDAHVHLVLDGEVDPIGRLYSRSSEDLLAVTRKSALVSLASGVTTVRDLGDKDYLSLVIRSEVANSPTLGPEIISSGPPITSSGGHCWFLGGEVEGSDRMREAVRDRARRGVDVVKVMASGGEITPGSSPWKSQFSLEELRVAVEEAHLLGLPITAHAHGVDSINLAVQAGFDMIEHCSFRSGDGFVCDESLMGLIRQSGIAISITTGFHPSGPKLSPAANRRANDVLSAAVEMHSMGIPIVCSSDAGISDQKPHGLLAFAASRLEKAGIPALDVLRSVTSLAAEKCRVGLRKGRIAPDYDADLVVVRSDPTASVKALEHVVAVYRLGQRVV